jgi:signal transduction histidine kinase
MKATPTTFRKFLEAFWPAVVLLTLLLYSYARFFLAPYVGFQFNSSTGRVSDVFVSQLQAPRLEIGDQLISINNYNFSDYVNDLHVNLYKNVQIGRSFPIVAQGADRVKTLSWQVAGFTVAEFTTRLLNTWFLSYVFWLAGTLTLLLVRPKDERWVSLIAFFYVTAIWLIAGALSASSLWASPFVLRAALWMSLPIYLHLHWNFPRPLRRIPLKLWAAFHAFAAGLATLQWIGLLPNSLYTIPFGFAILGSGLLLIYRAAFRPAERREIGLLFLAVLIAFGPALIIAVLTAQEAISTVSAGYLFSLLTVPGAYFYVVYRRQLGGAELRANRLISQYLFLILTLTICISVLPLLSGQMTPQGIGAAILLTGIGAALFSIFGFPRFQHFVEQRLLNITQAPELLLQSFAGRISTSFTREHLIDILQKEVLPSLLIRQSALVSVTRDGTDRETIYLQAVKSSELPGLKKQSALLASFQNSGRPLVVQEDRWLRLVIPLVVGKETLGLWLLGRKDPDDFYSYAEQSLLAALADQMAIALVNISQAQSLRALHRVDIGRQEEERVHLARELHDDILQRVNELATEAGEQIQSKEFDRRHHALDDRIRALIHGLRPPMLEYGLYHAFHELVDDLTDKATNKTRFELNLLAGETRYDPQVELFVYRIVQQACENGLEHSGAKTIAINGLCAPGVIDLSIIDDGRGFDLGAGTELAKLLAVRHFGLAGMKERATLIDARLEIASLPNKGTRIQLNWRAPDKKG